MCRATQMKSGSSIVNALPKNGTSSEPVRRIRALSREKSPDPGALASGPGRGWPSFFDLFAAKDYFFRVKVAMISEAKKPVAAVPPKRSKAFFTGLWRD